MSPARRPSETGIGRAVRQSLPAGTEQGAVTPDQPSVPVAPPLRTAGRIRQAPIRITVDLVTELHGYLRGYAQARDVAAADVIRELIRQLRSDPELSARVTAELARRREALAEAMRAARE